MLSNTFKTEIENYSFTKQGINSIKDCGDKGEDWPVVYILQEIGSICWRNTKCFSKNDSTFSKS